MDLSLNPASWSLGNIAEFAAEKLTGSEFIGDIVGAGVSYMTGDICGAAENAMDAGENVMSFLSDPRLGDALSDAFGIGSTPDPEQCPICSIGCGGAGGAGGTQGGSLEDRIFALLMKCLEKAEGEVEKNLEKAEASSGGGGEKAGKSNQKDMFVLQKSNDELKALKQLVTGILQAFQEGKMAVARNIR
ncbi:MAG: hypothetical protein ACYS22_20415 [Planctomycetota bacterium]|jgi:hypothetical protein